MIRLTALWLVVGTLAIYARRDWFVSLCGLILLMAVIEHPDAPKTMFGIQGLNFWNLLLAVVCYYWYKARREEHPGWDLPRGVAWLGAGYLCVMLVGFLRMIGDRAYLDEASTLSLVSEYLVNTFKWLVPGFLLFDGVRTRRRFIMGTSAVLGVYVLLALYVIKWMPLDMLTSGDELQQRALKILVNEVGYHRVTMSMMLAGASWAVFNTRLLVTTGWQRLLILGTALSVLFAQALTAGRMGYATWAAIGGMLLMIRGRAYLLLAPVVVLAVWILVPAVGQRLLEGITPGTGDYAIRAAAATGDQRQLEKVDLDSVTAGRTLIWLYVEAKIAQAPIAGYGLLAMQRTGLTSFLASNLGEGFAHPHNAYFELLLDNGVIGLVLVLPFYLLLLQRALSLYADTRSPIFMAAGGMAASLVGALLIASVGSQSFYPREGTVGMWCAIGLMMRVWVERERALTVPVSAPSTGEPTGALRALGGKPRAVAGAPLVWPGSAPPVPTLVAAGAPAAPETPTNAEDVDGRLWRRTA